MTGRNILRMAAVSIAIAAAIPAATVTAPDDAYQVRYAANFNVADSAINLTNVGSVDGFDPAGDICANVYVFAQDQQLIACCSCPLTPNHLKTLSVRSDLIANTLTPGVPTAITVALLASKGTTCNAATVTVANLVGGLRAWGTTPHAAPSGLAMTETRFLAASLSTGEFQKLTSYCGFTQIIGSGFGICKSCRTGASGAAKQ